MTFDDIQGNNQVKQALQNMVAVGKVPHAIMFHEDDGGGAMAFCLASLVASWSMIIFGLTQVRRTAGRIVCIRETSTL